MPRQGFPPGVPCWVDVTVPDAPAAADFYAGLFGWDMEDRVPGDAPGHYFIARLGGFDVAAVGDGDTPAWNTYIGVEDAGAGAARVAEAGGQVLVAPVEVGPAGRMAACADPAGATFVLWQPSARLGAELVNAPNTWNWSDLHTPDPDGARAFYGAVFGWEADDTEYGASMWRLPGYADFLEQFDPGLRQRHSDFGAPPGFSDAVGWMMPLEQGAPHWNVTFSVDDADAVAARAVELGGTVVNAPADAGPTRVAALRDPQGAEFTISQFRP